MNHTSLNQLLCAAVVSNGFRETLLRNPAQAIATGYLDHDFPLTPEERNLVVDIRAKRIEDFAAQVHDWLLGRSDGPGRNRTGSRDAFANLFRARKPVRA